jgi:hypothetical protein
VVDAGSRRLMVGGVLAAELVLDLILSVAEHGTSEQKTPPDAPLPVHTYWVGLQGETIWMVRNTSAEAMPESKIR